MTKLDYRIIGTLFCLLWAMPARAEPQPTPAQIEFFESRIRPVLVEHCYSCHNSVDTAEGGLSVDARVPLRQGGEGGPVVLPGNVKESRLLAILKHEVAGLEMPEGGPKLEPRIVRDFASWIEMGAPDPRDTPPTAADLAAETAWPAIVQRRKQWWSFQPISAPAIPETSQPEWSPHPIDRFLMQAWQEQELEPAPDAPADVLVRRLYFTLTGLPPTRDEAANWTRRLAQYTGLARTRTIEELVDHLLDSQAYAEHWARHWMDWIRYAESHGSEGDPPITEAWVYRDYLIRAWRDDVPYDQLVREHFAGDLLPQPRLNEALQINESLIGPAHLRMVFHGFSPTDALDERVRFTDDQINTISKAFLGLTISCARCHDHKFDPISQQDYYALFGIFNSCRPGRHAITLTENQQDTRVKLLQLKQEIRLELADLWLKNIERLPDTIRQRPRPEKPEAWARSMLAPWFTVRDRPDSQTIPQAWEEFRRGQVDFSHPSPAHANAVQAWNFSRDHQTADWFATGIGLSQAPLPPGTFSLESQGDRILAGIYPGGIYSHALSRKDPARLTSPDQPLQGEFDLWLLVQGGGGATARFVVQNYPRSGNLFPVQKLTPNWQWRRFDLAFWNGDRIHMELTTALDAPLLTTNQPESWFGLREALLLPKGAPAPRERAAWWQPLFPASPTLPETLDDVLRIYQSTLQRAIEAWRDQTLTDDQAELLERCRQEKLLPDAVDSSTTLRSLVAQYRQLEHQLPIPQRVPGLDETRGEDQPLYVRGNHKHPSAPVPRRFLEALDPRPYATEQSGRLQLAESLLREDNPLTRRVIVNRLWHHLYGQGLVSTPDNFGKLGFLPTHPELLDWLSTRFARDGWSLKQAIRLMVTARAWQLSSVPTQAARRLDPDNLQCSHARIRRLQAEAIRDSLLAVSGQLERQSFGPPVNGNSTRRSIYIQVQRNSLDPFLRAFDYPEPFTATGRRDATNVPAQSLMLMNDPMILRTAQAWISQLLAETATRPPEERIQVIFQQLLSRNPTPREIADTLEFLHAANSHAAESRQRAADIATRGQALQREFEAILLPARQHLLEMDPPAEVPDRVPQPVAHWDFRESTRERQHGLESKLHASARLERGHLLLDGTGYVTSAPLPFPLREKTLEAWVRLQSLDQRGGGVMTIQTPDGRIFDAIVFGEKEAGQWLAGSNNFLRTQSFAGPVEQTASQQPVHLALVYHADGRITGYRDGRPYGQEYRSRGLQEFAAGQVVVGFGVRHLPAGGNRMLRGELIAARLYDRALDPQDIAASFRTGPRTISQAELLASLTPALRERARALQAGIESLRREADELELSDRPFEEIPWLELARSLLTLQELIYLR